MSDKSQIVGVTDAFRERVADENNPVVIRFKADIAGLGILKAELIGG